MVTKRKSNKRSSKQSNKRSSKQIRTAKSPSININGVRYNGAGVMLLYQEAGKNYVILFYDLAYKNPVTNRRGMYSNPGGGVERDHYYLENTASAELREETANYFIVCPHIIATLPYVKVQNYANGKFRCYLTKVTKFDPEMYTNNVKILKKSTRTPYCWKETVAVRKFEVDEIRDAIDDVGGGNNLENVKYITAYAGDGVAHQITSRTARCFYEFDKRGYISEILKEKEIDKQFQSNIIKTDDNTFLSGTKSLLII